MNAFFIPILVRSKFANGKWKKAKKEKTNLIELKCRLWKKWKNAIPKFFPCKVNVKINDKILAGFGCNAATVKIC
jgi:hypothetical protein